ncbi:RNA polymerase sigma-70 factor [Aquimarina sp. AD10]|uniref:LuxR family transcriptional regulator n=1 Tax=Aquimarina aggregata TaxID=1642818 RepID=A0A163CXU2_9FLAO|nr:MULTISPECIES: RNA polymerase sigma-70 factor [Aquimarina]AXT62741.1 RNA polymerase sigma-70 factor [Aquimarina sp. AD10]KZS42851.1 LuxR family transcriptional regulator [Aquimarina aggregata]RKN01924.1 RNA polymerase sigma-70 factor [Aquimarina sp. AD10]
MNSSSYKKDFSDNAILVDSLKKGEEKAYIFLLDTYHRKLYAYALTLIDDPVIAEDIVQNVFLNTWQYRKKLNAKYVIKSFLYKSVYNQFINTYTKNKATMLLQMKYYEVMYEEVEKTDEKSLERIITLVSKEIEKLPPKCKEVFSLSKKEGLTNAEISEYLNISIKTVEAQITKAFTTLRKKLGNKIKVSLFLLFSFK